MRFLKKLFGWIWAKPATESPAVNPAADWSAGEFERITALALESVVIPLVPVSQTAVLVGNRRARFKTRIGGEASAKIIGWRSRHKVGLRRGHGPVFYRHVA